MINKTKLKEQNENIERIGVHYNATESHNNASIPRSFNDDLLKNNISIKDDCIETLFESKNGPYLSSSLSFTEDVYDSEDIREVNEWSDDELDSIQTIFETRLETVKMTVHWTDLQPDSSPTESLFKALGNKYLNYKSSSDV
jgi:hypothetical protein